MSLAQNMVVAARTENKEILEEQQLNVRWSSQTTLLCIIQSKQGVLGWSNGLLIASI